MTRQPYEPIRPARSALPMFLLYGVILGSTGCTSTAFRKEKSSPIERNPSAGTAAQLIDDLARPHGMHSVQVDGVSMVQGLNGTGSDAPPSSEREMLLEEMRVHSVEKPSQVLASNNTALVTVHAVLPPGIQKGDPIDVEVRVPIRNDTKSLQGGWLMPTRLREYARLQNRIAEGHLMGFAKGDVLVDAMFTNGDDQVTFTRGRVLGGGVASVTRNLGLTVRDEHLSVATSARIGEAINNRFFIYDRGLQRPVANPKRDRFVELLVHPRYQHNVIRYMRVIQSIPVRFGPGGIAARLQTLESELLNPATSAPAALKLEALGDDGIPVLEAGLAHGDPEVRFYSSEALGYLNEPTAVQGLVAAIEGEAAFRQRSFTALGAMDVPEAHEALIELMHRNSAETRYAAFRTLRRIMPDDPHVNGERLGDFHYHTVETTSEPLIHVLRSERPEIVMFGSDHPVKLPFVIYAGNQIVVKGGVTGGVVVTKIVAGEENQTTKCPADLDAIIRSVVDLGASYPDVVQAIAQAKSKDLLLARLEFDALPAANRTYQRSSDASKAPSEAGAARRHANESDTSMVAPKKKRMTQTASFARQPLNDPSTDTKLAAVVGKEPNVAAKAALDQAADATDVGIADDFLRADKAKQLSFAVRNGADSIRNGAETDIEPPLPADPLPCEPVSFRSETIDGPFGLANNTSAPLAPNRPATELKGAERNVAELITSTDPPNAGLLDDEIQTAPEPRPLPIGEIASRKPSASADSLATLARTIEFGQ